MPTVTQIDMNRLKGYVDSHNPVAYYTELSRLGYSYGDLALGVVNDSTVPGSTARAFFEVKNGDEGGSFDGNWGDLSNDLMRLDFAARIQKFNAAQSGDADVYLDHQQQIQIHQAAFREYGVSIEGWTAFPFLNVLGTDYASREAVWQSMIKNGFFARTTDAGLVDVGVLFSALYIEALAEYSVYGMAGTRETSPAMFAVFDLNRAVALDVGQETGLLDFFEDYFGQLGFDITPDPNGLLQPIGLSSIQRQDGSPVTFEELVQAYEARQYAGVLSSHTNPDYGSFKVVASIDDQGKISPIVVFQTDDPNSPFYDQRGLSIPELQAIEAGNSLIASIIANVVLAITDVDNPIAQIALDTSVRQLTGLAVEAANGTVLPGVGLIDNGSINFDAFGGALLANFAAAGVGLAANRLGTELGEELFGDMGGEVLGTVFDIAASQLTRDYLLNSLASADYSFINVVGLTATTAMIGTKAMVAAAPCAGGVARRCRIADPASGVHDPFHLYAPGKGRPWHRRRADPLVRRVGGCDGYR